MASALALTWELLARDQASGTFLRVAGAADKAAASTLKAQKGVTNASSKMATVGAKLTKGLTLPLAGLAAVSVDQAAKFQRSLNTIGTATDQTSSQLAASSKGLLNIAKSTGTSLSQLTDSLYVVEKGGLRGATALNTVKAAAQGAKAEGADLGTATQALTSIMASYGKSLGSPVQAENALIRGAGLAKTTYQDFAASLSNVVPIAAALHISFAQVAGAIDTMTQHGETAQRATDNLANLITNLAGQNSVASKSLQQLGVNTVDLSANLGKRGLSGSLDVVLNAIGKQSKGGLVVVSAFKQAAVATRSLQTELKAMPPTLRAQSQAFDKGSLSYKDYYAYVKSLGGQNFQLGKGFITTEQQAKGFSDQLKSGNGNVRTLASTLQKALGGVTGMRTALMLSGTSATQFTDDVAAVSKAAKTTGGDVLGWANTQGTLAVKLDKAKESLQVLAVEIGSALIPAVTKIVGVVTKAAGAFDGLSSTQKKVLEWGAGIALAIGPVLSIGSKLGGVARGFGNAAGSIGANLSLLSGSSFTTASRVSTAFRGLGAAIGGAGIGLAIGTLTRNSSSGVKAISALGAAAAGGLLGFQAGGPIGAAVGAGAGLLTTLAAGFKRAGSAAKANVSPIDSFTQAIIRDNDALGANVRALVATDLNKKSVAGKSAFSLAQNLGIDPKTLTDAVVGVKAAKAKIDAILATDSTAASGIRQNGNATVAIGQSAKLLGVADGAKITAAQVTELQKLQGSAKGVAAAIGAETAAAKAATKQAKDYTAATSTAGKNDTARAAQLKSITTQQKAAATTLAGLNQQIGVHGTSLDPKSGKDGASNSTYLAGLITQYQHIEKSQVLAGVAAGTAAKQFDTSTAALRTQAVAAGLSGHAVDGLISKYKLTPKQVVTYMLANIGKATASAAQLQSVINNVQQGKVPGLTADSRQGRAVIAALQARINALQGKNVKVGATVSGMRNVDALTQALYGLHDKTVSITTLVNTVKATTNKANSPQLKASGGVIHGPGTGTSDTAGVFALSNGEAVIPARAVSAHPGLVNALIRAGRGLAAGGTVSSTKKSHPLYSVGADGTQFSSLTALSNSIRSALRQVPIAMRSFTKSLTKTGADIRDAFARVLDHLKAAGLTKAQITRLTKIDNQVAVYADARNKYADQISAFKDAKVQEAGTVGDAVRGGFQVASAGASVDGTGTVTLGGILAQGAQQKNIAAKFAAGLIRLRKEGLGIASIQQLAEAGPGAYPQVLALLSATPKQLALLNGDQTSIAHSGVTLGGFVSGQIYDPKIKAAQKAEDHESSLLRKELALLRSTIKADEKKPILVTVNIDGKKSQKHLTTAANKNKRRK